MTAAFAQGLALGGSLRKRSDGTISAAASAWLRGTTTLNGSRPMIAVSSEPTSYGRARISTSSVPAVSCGSNRSVRSSVSSSRSLG